MSFNLKIYTHRIISFHKFSPPFYIFIPFVIAESSLARFAGNMNTKKYICSYHPSATYPEKNSNVYSFARVFHEKTINEIFKM